MRTIYIDENNICHADDAVGRIAYEIPELDNVCDNTLPCYRVLINGDNRFIQCFDSHTAEEIQKQYNESEQILSETLYRIEAALGI